MDITRDAKKRLAALVEERGGALAPLAAKIGVSQSTLWNFIYGETRNFSKIHRLATELKVSLDWIIGGDRPVAAAGRGTRRLSEPTAGQGFESAAADSDAILIRNIALAVATVARAYPALKDETIAAIAATLWSDAKSGKIPRGKAATKALSVEAQRLAAYEMGKSAF